MRRRKEMVDKIQSVRSAKPDERSAPRLHHFPTGWCSASGGHNRRFDFLNIFLARGGNIRKKTDTKRIKKNPKPLRFRSNRTCSAPHTEKKGQTFLITFYCLHRFYCLLEFTSAKKSFCFSAPRSVCARTQRNGRGRKFKTIKL